MQMLWHLCLPRRFLFYESCDELRNPHSRLVDRRYSHRDKRDWILDDVQTMTDTDTLLAELTALAQRASPAARAWLGKHIADDTQRTKRSKRACQRGIHVKLLNGAHAFLGEQYVRENAVEIEDVSIPEPCIGRGLSI
jgi:hypothetical protein